MEWSTSRSVGSRPIACGSSEGHEMKEKSPALQDEEDQEATSPESKEGAPRDELAELRRQNEELVTKLKHLHAEFENYRKRADRDAETVVTFAHELLISRLLPVLDEMDAAVAALDGKAGEGVRMVRDNLARALHDAGLKEIPTEGRGFGPDEMDCIEPGPEPEGEDGTVKGGGPEGDRLHDRVLRPAQRIVVKDRSETNG